MKQLGNACENGSTLKRASELGGEAISVAAHLEWIMFPQLVHGTSKLVFSDQKQLKTRAPYVTKDHDGPATTWTIRMLRVARTELCEQAEWRTRTEEALECCPRLGVFEPPWQPQGIRASQTLVCLLHR